MYKCDVALGSELPLVSTDHRLIVHADKPVRLITQACAD